MANFYEGDFPVAPFEYDLTEDAAEGATGILNVAMQSIPAEVDQDRLTGTWDTLEVPAPGKYPIYAELTVGDRTQGELVDYLIVDEHASAWHGNATARGDWPGAPASDGELFELLAIAKAQVLAYAPARYSEADAVIPVSFRRAQAMQARNLWNAITKDTDNNLGGEGYSAPVFPLDWQVKNLIRPNRGVPIVR